MAALHLSLAIITLISFSLPHHPSAASCGGADSGSTLQVIHVNSPCSPFRPKKSLSWEDSILQMQTNDESRHQFLSSLVAGRSIVPVASGRAVTQNPTYIVKVKIGTPPQQLLVALDTSNDAAWIPCSGCAGCSAATFNPAKSATYKAIPCGSPKCAQVPNPSCATGGKSCGFNITYGSSAITASLVQDNITLATDSVPRYTFGCVGKTTVSSFPAQGLLGLGRGPLSLLSQSTSLYKSTFSYCLPSYKSINFAGSLRLGPNSQPIRIKTTPLLKNPRRSSLYYVSLLAIRVGRKVVDIPPSALAFDANTGAGTVFDSGTVFTMLVRPAYEAVRNELRRRMRGAAVTSLGGFDTCYSGAAIRVPTITFMFSGMNVTLAQDNFIIRSSAGNTACLAMAAAPEPAGGHVNSVLNVIASFQQQNHRILIDGPKSKLGVARETCS